MNPHSITLPQFVLEPSAAESLAQSLNLPSVLHLLPRLVHSAQSFARPIISNFHVAAVGLGSDGRVFVGVNLEFAGLPLHHSVHAEQFLLTNLALHGCPRLLSFAVSDAPCGHCRQFYQELRHSSSLQILVIDRRTCVEDHHGSESLEIEPPDYLPLSKILPNPFGPRDLLAQEAPLLLERHDNGLDLYLPTDASENQNCDQMSIGKIENFEKGVTILRKTALEAANNAHAPYSGCPSGVALLDCEGNVYKGSYVESAAYNPSFGPVQAALVAYVARGGGNYDRIVEAVLVEKEDAKVKQEDTARILLKAVSPKCEFRAFYCQSLGHVCEKVSV